jgi:RNA polymerase sigma-70 factor (ECF subfamily)
MGGLAELNDDELLARSRAGDERAFTALYRRRQAGIYRFALQMSGSAAIAEEVTQEAFLVLIRWPERYDPARGLLASFLYGVARNYVLRLLDGQREGGPLDEEDAPPVAATVLGDLARAEQIDSVRQAVLSLPVKYREAVVLCDLQEQSYEDAAAALGCAVGTVRSRLHRGRALLMEKLSRGAYELC